jgi:hypothetical protein
MLYKFGVYTRTVLRLTLGGLQAVRQRGELSEEEFEPTGMQKLAEGIVGTQVRAEGPNDGQEGSPMLDRGNAPGQQFELPFAVRRGEAAVGASGRSTPVGDEGLMERVVERGNLLGSARPCGLCGVWRPAAAGVAPAVPCSSRCL